MRFIDIILDVESISLVKDNRPMVKRAINATLQRVHQAHNFPYYLQDKGVIQTTAEYTDGTVTAVNGDATITGILTAFTSAMAGRKFRKGGETAFYRIKSVTSGTELELETPYYGTTDATGETFSIFKDEFRLAPDVDQYKFLRQIENGEILFSTHPANFDSAYPAPSFMGNPNIEVMVGTQMDTYDTGSVSGSSGSKTLTGVGTGWTSVEGLGQGSQLTIGDYVYMVKSVDSDTQITLYDKLAQAVTAGTSYSILLNNLRVQLLNIPDEAKNLYYRYFRIPQPLVNDYDIPDMPMGWDWILPYGALSQMFLQKGDLSKSYQITEARFLAELDKMKLKVGSFTPDRIYHKKPMQRRRNVSLGQEPSGYRWYYCG
ncbi:MAG: hypothetical protein PHQ22_10435 [Sulfuricurvum sp.]|nr:hypothetical protein [Sulfuricurvum sp.]